MNTTLVVLADTHVGHPFALCPAQWNMRDEQLFKPSALQDLIRKHWLQTWDTVAQWRKKRRLIVIINGDVCEGIHHNSTQLLTTRLDVQEAMAVATIEEGLALAKFNSARGDILRLISGTHAHDGPGIASLERVAQRITGESGQGRLTQDRFLAEINDVLFDIAHKPGSGAGARVWTRENQFRSWLISMRQVALDRGKKPPRYVIRAHRHDYMRSTINNIDGELVLTGYILAPWKARDEYVVTLKPEAVTNIGAVLIDIDTDGATREAAPRIEIEMDRVEKL